MKSCCDEYCSNHGCNQGRDCPARALPITMEDQQPSIFELICDFGVAAILAVGTVTTALVITLLLWRWFV